MSSLGSSFVTPVREPTKCRKFCSVPGCGTRGVKMFTFPRDMKAQVEWKRLCEIKRQISRTMYVCQRHFDSSDVYKTRK